MHIQIKMPIAGLEAPHGVASPGQAQAWRGVDPGAANGAAARRTSPWAGMLSLRWPVMIFDVFSDFQGYYALRAGFRLPLGLSWRGREAGGDPMVTTADASRFHRVLPSLAPGAPWNGLREINATCLKMNWISEADMIGQDSAPSRVYTELRP